MKYYKVLEHQVPELSDLGIVVLWSDEHSCGVVPVSPRTNAILGDLEIVELT